MKTRSISLVILTVMATIALVVAGCAPAETPPSDEGAPEADDGKEESEAPKAPEDEVIKWRLVDHEMAGMMRYEEETVAFCQAVEAASNGRLVIEPFGAGVLFPVFESFEAVQNETVEAMVVNAMYWGGKDPAFNVSPCGGLPGCPLRGFSENFSRAEAGFDATHKLYQQFDLELLGAFDHMPGEMVLSNVPIESLSDFEGVKIRSAGVAVHFFEAIGASVITMASTDLYTAMQLGTIDAMEYSDPIALWDLALYEVSDYVIEPDLHSGPCIGKDLVVNPDAWAELSDDLKAIVLVARDRARYKSAITIGGAAYESKRMEWYDKNELIMLPEEDVDEARTIAMELIAAEKSKSPIAEELVLSYADTLETYGYSEYAEILRG